MSNVMWTERYRPKNLEEIVGNEEAKHAFVRWLGSWKIGEKAALLYGPPGVGKTTLIQVVAKVFNYDLVEMNASDIRTAEKILRVAGRASSEASLLTHFSDSRGTVILLDEVDGIYGREDQGGIGAVLKLIEESKVPIALVANDVSDVRLRELKAACIPIRFYSIRPPALIAMLTHICQAEKIECEKKALAIIVSRSGGDARSAVNDLQAFSEKTGRLKAVDVESLIPRDKQLTINEALQGIFLAKSPMQAKRLLSEAEVNYEMFQQAIHDNLPYQYKEIGDFSSAYEALSEADVFLGRAKRTGNWGLLRYALEQMSAGVAASRGKDYPPVAYRFPPWKLIILSQSRIQRELRNRIAARIGEKCHISRRRAISNCMPYIKAIFKNDGQAAEELASWLNLDEDMLAYLAERTVKPPTAAKRRKS